MQGHKTKVVLEIKERSKEDINSSQVRKFLSVCKCKTSNNNKKTKQNHCKLHQTWAWIVKIKYQTTSIFLINKDEWSYHQTLQLDRLLYKRGSAFRHLTILCLLIQNLYKSLLHIATATSNMRLSKHRKQTYDVHLTTH